MATIEIDSFQEHEVLVLVISRYASRSFVVHRPRAVEAAVSEQQLWVTWRSNDRNNRHDEFEEDRMAKETDGADEGRRGICCSRGSQARDAAAQATRLAKNSALPLKLRRKPKRNV